MKWIDDLLNGTTMYKLVLYALGTIAGAAILLSALGTLGYSVGSLVGSLLLLAVVCVLFNRLLGFIYKLPVNQESALITALILFFILLPPTDRADWLALVVAGVAAIASKYIFTWRHASIFNPAAVGALVVGLTHLGSPGWWVASRPLFIFCLLAGLVVIRKVRRFTMFFCFAAPAFILSVYWLLDGGTDITNAIQTAAMSYPILFLGAFMLTEPSSMPQTRTKQLIFAGLVGLLFASRIRVGDVSVTPHLALILGNVYVLAVSTRTSVSLKLVKKTQLAPNILDLAFQPERPLPFTAGQYMEWTLSKVKLDSRGNRRTFTIASSPLEKLIHIGLKTYQPSSAYKDKLLAIKPGDTIEASHVAGDFVLPHDPSQKLVFIAGGIGVTPFRSMVADIMLRKQHRDIVLFYLAATDAEIVYKDVWKSAASSGVKMIPLTNGEKLTAELLLKTVPTYKNHLYYISGPPPMVRSYKTLLKSAGVSSSRIHTDYFSGY